MAVGQHQWYHVRGAPILEPILVGIGMFTGGTIWVSQISKGSNSVLAQAEKPQPEEARRPAIRGPAEHVSSDFFGAFCLDVRTLTFCQLMGFPFIKPSKVKLLAGEQKATKI